MVNVYDIVVVGAGPAGCMAAIRAAQFHKKVLLIERNHSIGRKLLLTGNGRCNFTNTAFLDSFIKKFSPRGEFFRSAFFLFSNADLIDFFKSKGLDHKVEKYGKVFPVTDKADSVLRVLKEYLGENNLEVVLNRRVVGIQKENDLFILDAEKDVMIKARKVILATGGVSYKTTGSTGDGFCIARSFGHTIIPLKPALVPLVVKEQWVKDVQGVSLENVRLQFQCRGKKVISEKGEMIFTHFGISGPLVLDVSGDVVIGLGNHTGVSLYIDFMPDFKKEDIEFQLMDGFVSRGSTQIKTVLSEILPKRMVTVFLGLLNIEVETSVSQITRKNRTNIVEMLKGFPLIVTGSRSIDEAMVTNGGVAMKEINPRAMESKLVPGFYFAGEIIEGAAASGGYNLQQAFSTGYLAGEKAAQ